MEARATLKNVVGKKRSEAHDCFGAAVASLRFALALLVLFFALSTPLARAHELQPGYLELREHSSAADTFAVTWKIPAREDLASGVELKLPAAATPTNAAPHPRQRVADAWVEHFEVRIAGGIDGREFTTTGATARLVDVLVRIVRADGRVQLGRLTPDAPVWTVPAKPTWLDTTHTFVRLGVEHIVTGVDHLLFVLGLLLIVRGWRMLLQTITAFTIAHSLTLAIATLGFASAPLPPLNLTIALSILFLGPEVLRVQRGEDSFTTRRPWVVAFAFGLLHGFGFASGLTELGLDRAEIPAALWWFNVGVELGQLAFVGLVFALIRAWRVLEIAWPRWSFALPAWTIGVLGAFWTIDRFVAYVAALS